MVHCWRLAMLQSNFEEPEAKRMRGRGVPALSRRPSFEIECRNNLQMRNCSMLVIGVRHKCVSAISDLDTRPTAKFRT